MTRRPKRRLQGIVAPVLPGKPLFIRLCEAFVDNLAMILRGALIAGALVLAQQFGSLTENLSPAVVELEPPVEEPAIIATPLPPAESPGPVVSDRARHYLNCTYEAYRRENYAECVDEPSRIYRPPEADPDDTGSLLRPSPLRFAHRAARPGPGYAEPECLELRICSALL